MSNLADVSALGRLEPFNGISNIAAPSIPEAGTTMVLGELFVKPGDFVEKGQLLAITEATGFLEALVNETTASLALAKREAEEAGAVANATCVLAEVTRKEADRRQSLLAQKLSSIEESERAYADAQFQDASCLAAKANIASGLARVNLAEARLVSQNKKLARTRIYAPMTGRVLDVNVWPGEMIGPMGILQLADVGRMYAIAELYETDIKLIRVGQTAKISSAAVEDVLTGVVERIRPLVRKQDVMGTDPASRKDARIIEVEIRLDSPSKVQELSNLQVEILIKND